MNILNLWQILPSANLAALAPTINPLDEIDFDKNAPYIVLKPARGLKRIIISFSKISRPENVNLLQLSGFFQEVLKGKSSEYSNVEIKFHNFPQGAQNA